MKSFTIICITMLTVALAVACVERRTFPMLSPATGDVSGEDWGGDPADTHVPADVPGGSQDTGGPDLYVEDIFDAGADLAQHLNNVGFGEFWIKVEMKGTPFEQFFGFVDVQLDPQTGNLALLFFSAVPKDGIFNLTDPLDLVPFDAEDGQMAFLTGKLEVLGPGEVVAQAETAHLNLTTETHFLGLQGVTLTATIGEQNEFTPLWTGSLSWEVGEFFEIGEAPQNMGGVQSIEFQMFGLTGDQMPAVMYRVCHEDPCADFAGNCSEVEDWLPAGVCD